MTGTPFFVSITANEKQRLEQIIDNWGNPDYFDDAPTRVLATGLLQNLIVLNGVCQVPGTTSTDTEVPLDTSWVDNYNPPSLEDHAAETDRDFIPIDPVFGGEYEIVGVSTVNDEDEEFSFRDRHVSGRASVLVEEELIPASEHNIDGWSAL